MSYGNNDSASGIAIIIVIALIAGVLGISQCYNYSGANSAAAVDNARSFSRQMWPGKDVPFTCADHDTDGDGYVSCNFNPPNGPVQTFECAGQGWVQINHGCRQPKLQIRRR